VAVGNSALNADVKFLHRRFLPDCSRRSWCTVQQFRDLEDRGAWGERLTAKLKSRPVQATEFADALDMDRRSQRLYQRLRISNRFHEDVDGDELR
jgi:hypothetical protein